ncbi:MAG: capsule assembly Wzi family protein, partial [Bacteroidales bacterium]|nr:capsule assembly Wzi family protein [Bacteroidales bacterium]
MKHYLILLFCCTASLFSNAQITHTYRVESFGSLSSGKNTPFWMVNRNWGVIPLEADNFYLRASSFYEQRLSEDWLLDAGVDVIGSNNDNYGNFWLQQLYGRLQWKKLRLDIGSREDYLSFLNPYLSSGDFMHSNNARPIPQVKVSISDFLLIPYTKGNMYIKGDFSVGWFLDGKRQEDIARPFNQDYAKKELSHNKSVFFRFGNIEEKNRMQFTLGLIHATKWGGELYQYRYINNEWIYSVTKHPKGLDDFFRVVIAKEGSSSSSRSDKEYL